MRRLLIAAVLIGLFAVTACTPAPAQTAAPATEAATAETAPLSAAYVGAFAEDSTAIGLAVENGQVIAYVCDGLYISEWLRGDLVDNTFDGTSAHGLTLHVTFDATSATGTAALPDNEPLEFTAELAQGDAGLYRDVQTYDEVEYVAGWVLLNDGRQVGGIGFGGGGFQGGSTGQIGQFGGQIGQIGGFGGQTGFNNIGGFGFGGQTGLNNFGGTGQLGGQTGLNNFGGTGQLQGGTTGGTNTAGTTTSGTTETGTTTAGTNTDGSAASTTTSETTTTGGEVTTGTTDSGASATTGGTSDGSTTGGTAAPSNPTPTFFPAPPFDPKAGSVETIVGVFRPRRANLFLESN